MHKTGIFALSGFQVFALLMLALVLVSSPACKSKKKLLAEQQAREQAELAARTDRAISELRGLKANMALDPDEKERRLMVLKDRYGDLKDSTVLELFEDITTDIAKAREKQVREEAEATAQAAAEAEAQAELKANKPKLITAFSGISSASTRGEANNRIQEALTMFASPNVPVLVVISEVGGMVDYDKPTTIEKYLNYLKDTRNNTNVVKNVELDANGKIVELELVKTN
jgi:hypothetical protein